MIWSGISRRFTMVLIISLFSKPAISILIKLEDFGLTNQRNFQHGTQTKQARASMRRSSIEAFHYRGYLRPPEQVILPLCND